MYLNRLLSIRVHRVTGRATAESFFELAAFYSDHPDLAQFDLVSLVDEHAVPYVTVDELRRLRARFVGLQSRIQPLLVRRSAWVCPNVQAWPLLETWLHERHSRDAMRTEVCLVADLSEAAFLFDEDELAAVRDWTGFEEIGRVGEELA